MGTSLSGLTPATTFDGLLKVGDNDPLTATLKAISTGDGTDTMLELSTSALRIGGATGMYWDNTNKRLGVGTDAPSTTFEVYGAVRFRNNLNLNGTLSNSSTGEVNINNLGFFDAVSSNVGVGESIPTSRLHVKGSGNDNTTTALLVQNSAGSELFKLNDEGNINLGEAGASPVISAAKNSGKSLKLGNQAHLSSFDTIDFKTWDGTAAYTEVMRITGNTDQFVGIGETTPTARLHVKGSGNDNTTTSLLVQNSDGLDMVKVTDDGDINMLPNLKTLTIGNRENGLGGQISISPNNQSAIAWQGSNGTLVISGRGKGIFLGDTAATPTARLQVKGSGNDATTTALLVQNSAGDDMVKITDDSDITLSKLVTIRNSSAGLFARMYADGYGAGGPLMWVNGSVNLGSAPSTAAKLSVKGSGNDATTTALLVQNSDGADMLKVLDNGQISASGDRLTIGDSADVTLRILASGNAAAGNNYIQPLGTPANQRVVVTGNSVATIKAVDLDASNVYIGHGINQTAATGTLSIKGSGATSATTALLVQNSAGTELFKVLDDGAVSATTFYAGTSIIRQNSFRINQQWLVSGAGGQGLKIGTSNTAPDNSAKLEVDSTTQGFLPPRMTDAEKNAIATPAAGLMVYDTDANQMSYWNGSAWVNF